MWNLPSRFIFFFPQEQAVAGAPAAVFLALVGVLRRVHAVVGNLDVLFEGFRARGVVFADAAGNRGVFREARLSGEAFELVADGRAEGFDAGKVLPADDDEEFIAADTGAEILRARRLEDVFEDGGRHAQQAVARRMAVEVVRLFEPIDVEEEDGVAVAEAQGAHSVKDTGTREQARQHVLERHALVDAVFLRMYDLPDEAVDVAEDDGQEEDEQAARDDLVCKK